MPAQNIHVVQEPGSLEEAFEQLAKLQKTLRYLLNGNLDFENVRVKGLTAETIDVEVLSAITANLGHIIAGILEAVEIFGSYISTNRYGYPKAEMSNTQNLFKASSAPGVEVGVEASALSTSSPAVTFSNLTSNAMISMNQTFGFIILSNRDVEVSSNQTLKLNGGQVRFQGGTAIDTIFQPNSAAATLPALVADFNTLLTNLRSMNILA